MSMHAWYYPYNVVLGHRFPKSASTHGDVMSSTANLNIKCGKLSYIAQKSDFHNAFLKFLDIRGRYSSEIKKLTLPYFHFNDIFQFLLHTECPKFLELRYLPNFSTKACLTCRWGIRAIIFNKASQDKVNKGVTLWPICLFYIKLELIWKFH